MGTGNRNGSSGTNGEHVGSVLPEDLHSGGDAGDSGGGDQSTSRLPPKSRGGRKPGGKVGIPSDPRIVTPRAIKERLRDGLSPVGAPDDPLRDSHPNLAAWLTFRSWNGLVARELGRLSTTPTPTGWTVSISGYAEAQKVTVRVQYFHEWMDALEAALRDGSGDWTELEVGKGAQTLKQERRKLLDAEESK
jgi:hypothetical protein